jgi:hydrogenase maturation protease
LSQAPLLVFGYGNPSRGDDALGPALIDWLGGQQTLVAEVELLTDFQLQIEHALDLAERRLVLFADASREVLPPWDLSRLQPKPEQRPFTHAMSATAVLEVYRRIHGREPPPCYLLAIRGYGFELGQPLSAPARRNLSAAEGLLERLLSEQEDDAWGRLAAAGPAPS